MKKQILSSPDFHAKALVGFSLYFLGISSLFVSSTSLLILGTGLVLIFSAFAKNMYYSKTENKSKNCDSKFTGRVSETGT